ncbi:MAG TPA: DUF4157 domain-containing protein [Ilumatobacteraceae bacterium]|nr:DUF4157 domain-containing protein [Ilumatobacteraceae bacterium]
MSEVASVEPREPKEAARVAPIFVQRRLTVGSSTDPLEREADRMAVLVSRAMASSPPGDSGVSKRVVRFVGAPVPEPPGSSQIGQTMAGSVRRISRSAATPAGGVVDADVEAGIRGARGGHPLDETVQRRAGAVLGADLSDVRLHAGARAKAFNEDVQAEAFTHGSQIFFRSGLPDTSTSAGRELLGHELTHTVQQAGTAQRRVQRKDKVIHQPAVGLALIDDWVAYSGGAKPKRSPELLKVDTAVAAWATGGRKMGGAIDTNITQLQAVISALDAWRAKKKTNPSVRDVAVADLRAFATGELNTFNARKTQKAQDATQAQGLHDEFAKIDDQTGQFAKKNTVDIKPERFLGGNQSPALMAHTQKNADGSLTDTAMDALDDLQLAERDGLIAKARGEKITVDPDVSPDDLRKIMADSVNPLSGETLYPELATVSDPTTAAPGEVTIAQSIAGSNFQVTYDPSDPNAAVRLGALDAAVKLINATQAHVPDLDVYFPKAGRTVEVDKACQVTVKKGIADAVFYAPAFFAVSSANVGNPKDDKSGTDFKFLSTALSAADGYTTALRNSIIHELGHACHYANDRSRFYNLNFAQFTGKASDGRTFQDVAEQDVSGYGNNPREMVAEVFLAAVVGGKTFSPVVLQMYQAFGGAAV